MMIDNMPIKNVMETFFTGPYHIRGINSSFDIIYQGQIMAFIYRSTYRGFQNYEYLFHPTIFLLH